MDMDMGGVRLGVTGVGVGVGVDAGVGVGVGTHERKKKKVMPCRLRNSQAFQLLDKSAPICPRTTEKIQWATE
jgi:hypothetical protein